MTWNWDIEWYKLHTKRTNIVIYAVVTISTWYCCSLLPWYRNRSCVIKLWCINTLLALQRFKAIQKSNMSPQTVEHNSIKAAASKTIKTGTLHRLWKTWVILQVNWDDGTPPRKIFLLTNKYLRVVNTLDCWNIASLSADYMRTG